MFLDRFRNGFTVFQTGYRSRTTFPIPRRLRSTRFLVSRLSRVRLTVAFERSLSSTISSVTLRRDRSYVERRASVGIQDPATDEEAYSVMVDLTNGTVTRITDWDAVGTDP